MTVLITAGPTWIKVDDIRILTTIFSGKTGLYLAKEFKSKGCPTTLFINPHSTGRIRGMRVIYFRYFEELKERIVEELKRSSFDVIIHSAAVSDYKLKKPFRGKIASGKRRLTLELSPTEKIVKVMRRMASKSVLVQFKLQIERKGIIEKAFKSLKENGADFVVANAYQDLKKGYKGFLIDRKGKISYINSKRSLFTTLYKKVKEGG